MPKALIVENDQRDAERLKKILIQEALEPVVCQSGSEAEDILSGSEQTFAVAFLSAEVPGPPFGMELIIQCRKSSPQMPVIMVSGALDIGLAARAASLGASDFIERPLDDVRLRSCLHEIFNETDPLFPLMQKLRETPLGENGEKLIGESPAFLDTLRQVARLIAHPDSRVLILGESGTGKELVAKAIHSLGPRATRPWVAVNIGETPSTLVEAALFGHEKGAFTDARDQRHGFLELARDGTLFLDEIGDLELPLQGKLLRVVQERQFRRLGGASLLRFDARLICATNVDLARAVQEGTFRRDLYHRIAEVVVHVPPLHERHGDVDHLLTHFLKKYGPEKQSITVARETQTILRGYPFPGNIRELQNMVKGALIQLDGDVILPRHLPLATMGRFLQSSTKNINVENGIDGLNSTFTTLFTALQANVPENWIELPYRDAIRALEQVFDRIYLQRRLEKAKHNVTKAASSASLDTKTFRKHWKECGLPPLGSDEEQTD
jgi:DNA-binding NtrC family response regulator